MSYVAFLISEERLKEADKILLSLEKGKDQDEEIKSEVEALRQKYKDRLPEKDLIVLVDAFKRLSENHQSLSEMRAALSEANRLKVLFKEEHKELNIKQIDLLRSEYNKLLNTLSKAYLTQLVERANRVEQTMKSENVAAEDKFDKFNEFFTENRKIVEFLLENAILKKVQVDDQEEKIIQVPSNLSKRFSSTINLYTQLKEKLEKLDKINDQLIADFGKPLPIPEILIRGLPQKSNSCYLAAVLQIFCSIPEYAKALEKELSLKPPRRLNSGMIEHDTEQKLMLRQDLQRKIRELIGYLRYAHGKNVSAKKLDVLSTEIRKILAQLGVMIEGDAAAMQDAAQILRYIMEFMDVKIDFPMKTKLFLHPSSPISDWPIVMKNPGNPEPFIENQEIPSQPSSEFTVHIKSKKESFEKLLEGVFLVEATERKFSFIENGQKVVRMAPILNQQYLFADELPNVIQINAYEMDQSGDVVQNRSRSIPLTIPEIWTPPGTNTVYELNSVIRKPYGGASTGHYTAYVKDAKGNWYYCDDSKVTKASIEDNGFKTAQTFYYVKRKEEE